MKELEIKNFKAFGTDGAKIGGVSPDGKIMNVLCYGENGAGKSSLYEAIKYVFHKARIEQEKIPAHYTGVQRRNAEQQILLDYKNKKSQDPPLITVNNQTLADFDSSNYYVYMIDCDDLLVKKQIDIRQLLLTMYLADHDINNWLTNEVFETVINETNDVLRDYFLENVQIEKSQNGDFLLKINDDKKDLHYDDDLKIHFNEAKLHLIVLLVLLSSIELLAPVQTNAKKILVLDDFITSLDTANRTFLYQYITKRFKTFQVIIFTHNTSFYNLCDHFLKEDTAIGRYWLRQGVYEYNDNHYVYAKTGDSSVKAIETELNANPGRIADIGNEVRQYFEVLLHQLSLMLMAGAKEETKEIIKEIRDKSDDRIFHIDQYGISDLRTLFKEINSIMKKAPENEQWGKVKDAIRKFKDTNNSAYKLSENVQAMAIYQKVALHQASHGHEGLPDLSVTEIKASLHVLKQLEETIKKMKIERI